MDREHLDRFTRSTRRRFDSRTSSLNWGHAGAYRGDKNAGDYAAQRARRARPTSIAIDRRRRELGGKA